jgi:hypothetical protein
LHVKYIDVIMVKNVHAILYVTGFWSVGRKLEVGIGAALQVYDTTCFFFEFTDCTPKWVVNLASATPAGDKSPFTVSSVVHDEEVWNFIHDADGYGDCFVPLARASGT